MKLFYGFNKKINQVYIVVLLIIEDGVQSWCMNSSPFGIEILDKTKVFGIDIYYCYEGGECLDTKCR